jgi:hypothetical protein
MIPCVFLEIQSVVLEINPLPMIATLFLSGFPGLQKDPCKNPQKRKMIWNLRITFVGSGGMAFQYF